jgi:SAM-dependent methyltransferase
MPHGGDRDHRRTRISHNRDVWSTVNATVADAEAHERWDAPLAWGLFQVPESELRLAGDVRGAHVVELGCGTAYVSAALARAGAHVAAVDLNRDQLETARRAQRRTGITFPLLEANAEEVPLRSGRFDLAVSEYGVSPWCDPAAWVPEAARLLRPGGRLVFLTNSVIAGLCVPEEAGFASDRLRRAQRELSCIAWPGGGIEHHPGHGDWIARLVAAGLVVEALHELYAPAGADARAGYDIVTGAWARRWPAEDVWVASKPA